MRTFGVDPSGRKGRSGTCNAVAFLSQSRDLVVFLLFGGIASLVNLATGWTLYGTALLPGLPYWFAMAAAGAAGLGINFGLNYSFNFKFRARPAAQQFRTFCVVAGFGILLQSFLASVLRLFLEIVIGPMMVIAGHELRVTLAAHVVAVALVALYSFPAHKYLSFNVGVRARMLQLGQLARR